MRFLKVFVGLSLLMTAPLRGEVPAAAVKGLYTQMKQGAEDFSPVFGFLALKSGVLPNERFFGNYEKTFKTRYDEKGVIQTPTSQDRILQENNKSSPTSWMHPAFKIKDTKGITTPEDFEEENRRNFTRQFEYPLDAISALIQWLFPSVDGVLFVANNRKADPVGLLGGSIINSGQIAALLSSRIQELQQKLTQPETLSTFIPNHQKVREKKGITVAPRKGSLSYDLNLLEKTDPDLFANLLGLIYETHKEGISQGQFKKRLLGIIPQVGKTQKGHIILFSDILYAALVQDGTFGKRKEKDGALTYPHDDLYPRHSALHALLGYLWRVADTKEQVVHIMDKAGLLKAKPASHYERADYQRIKEAIIENPENASLEDLAYGGYGYELYEKKYPEPIVYAEATQPNQYPDCGETALRNFFNVILFKGAGEFDPSLLNQYQNSWTNTVKFEQIKKFYTKFSTVESQKSLDARNAWSMIVSNLNGTPSPDPSKSTDVIYGNGMTDIKAYVGIKNILNVMAKLTGDNALSAPWEGNGTQQISKKLERLGVIFNRVEAFEIEFSEQDYEKKEEPFHGNFIFTVTRHHESQEFTFYINHGHFDLSPPQNSRADWRATLWRDKLFTKTIFEKNSSIILNTPLLEPFYRATPTSPFLNPLITDPYKMGRILGQWENTDQKLPLTLRYLYKMYGAQARTDEHAQGEIMKRLYPLRHLSPDLNSQIKEDPLTQDFVRSLLPVEPFYREFGIIDYNHTTPSHLQSAKPKDLGFFFSFSLYNLLKQHIQDEKNLGNIENLKKNFKALYGRSLSNDFLRRALIDGQTEMVCLILENDEEISLEHEEAILSTALSKKLKDIVDIILQKKVRKGVLLNLLEDEDGQLIVKKGMTLLEWVIKNGYLKTLKVLLEKGADINDQSEWYKQTPLHYAVDKGDIKMVKLLLDHGPNTTLKTNMGKTALDLAETDEMKKLLHDHHAQSKSSITIGTTEHKDGY